jgi:predicted nucleotidyltransferase
MELEDVKNKLSKLQYDYFIEFQEQIDLPLYFVGSIARSDYVKDKSDLDIEVFSDKILSTKLKIENLLNYDNKNKKLKIMTFNINGEPISGYKYFYEDSKRGIKFDLMLYNNECKDIQLYYRKIEYNLPFTYIVLMNIIKFLYYDLHILSKKQYSNIKSYFWSFYIPQKSTAYFYDETDYKQIYNNSYPNIKYLVKL